MLEAPPHEDPPDEASCRPRCRDSGEEGSEGGAAIENLADLTEDHEFLKPIFR